MLFGIIAAMPEELDVLKKNLVGLQEERILASSYYTGYLSDKEVVLVQSGIGKSMAAMSVAILAHHFQVDVVINTGSAGAVAEGLSVGDIVIADRLVYHDVDVTAFDYAYGQMAGQPLYFEAAKELIPVLSSRLDDAGMSYKKGLIATGDSFVSDNKRLLTIKRYFPDVLAVEMEGAAVAQAAYVAGKPFLVIRAMSDTADHSAAISFDDFILEAGTRSAQVLMAFLKGL